MHLHILYESYKKFSGSVVFVVRAGCKLDGVDFKSWWQQTFHTRSDRPGGPTSLL